MSASIKQNKLVFSTLLVVSLAFSGCAASITSRPIANNQYEVTVNDDANVGVLFGIKLNKGALSRKWVEKAASTCGSKGFKVITREISEGAATGIIECKK